MEIEEVIRRIDNARSGKYTERGYSKLVVERVRYLLELEEKSERVTHAEVLYSEPHFFGHSVDVHLTEKFHNLDEFVQFLEQFQLPFNPCAKIIGGNKFIPPGYHIHNYNKGKRYVRPHEVDDGEYHAVSLKPEQMIWSFQDRQSIKMWEERVQADLGRFY